jgi:hypothetical protein
MQVELYTFEDVKKDLERGERESVAALKKWKSILDALEAIEKVSVQITSFCVTHQKSGCKTCPLLKYDYPCGHPYSTFTIFYQELRKLNTLAAKLYGILKEIDKEDLESKKYYA